MIVAASVAGYHIIMRMQSVLTWVTGIVTVGYILLTLKDVDWSAVQSLPSGPAQAVVGALVLVMTGFGLGWINIAADWSRYQRRDASGAAIVGWNTFGGAVAPVILVIYGLLLAGSDPALKDGIAADPIGTLATLLPTWLLVPFLIAVILSLVSGAVLGIYSSGLTLLSLGVRIPRPAAALVDGVILTLGTIYVVFFAESFIGPFQSFLITLGVPLAAWAGIMIADIALRKRDYDDDDLFDARGRYGAFDWVSIGTMVVTSIIGWGLVVNSFATDAAWNNWQGYLLEPLGLGTYVTTGEGAPFWDGNWPYSNIGVLLALVLGFVVTYVARRGRVRRQEAAAPTSATTVGEREPVQVTDASDGGWLVVIDPQAVFADPATSPWGSAMWAATVPRIVELAASFGPERTVVTRFVADPTLGGSWGRYYRDWAFALVPDDHPLYAVVPELADVAGHVVTAGTFGKWPVLRELLGDDAHVTLTGVSTDCCVLSTALPAADAGATVRVVRDGCAGSTPENHERALAAMALYAPQITII